MQIFRRKSSTDERRPIGYRGRHVSTRARRRAPVNTTYVRYDVDGDGRVIGWGIGRGRGPGQEFAGGR